jgi:hypothetical protein
MDLRGTVPMWLTYKASAFWATRNLSISRCGAAATFRHLQGEVSHTNRISVIYFEHELLCNGSESNYSYRAFLHFRVTHDALCHAKSLAYGPYLL